MGISFINRNFLIIILFIFLTINEWNRTWREVAIDDDKLWQNQSLTREADAFINRDMVFVVGAQSSGTTLMRLLLDVHPEVNCGDETFVIFYILDLINFRVLGSPSQLRFLSNFAIKNSTIEKATALFIYYVMENNKKNPQVDTTKVKYLCNKGI